MYMFLFHPNRPSICAISSSFIIPSPTETYTLSLHDALPIFRGHQARPQRVRPPWGLAGDIGRSEEHTSELQSRPHLVCRLLLEKKKTSEQRAETFHVETG